MTLERIENQIIDKANAEARSLGDDAREAAEQTVSRASDKIEADYASAVEKLKAQLRNEFEQETGMLRAGHRMELLKIKTGILDDVFRKAREKLLVDQEYGELIRRQLASLAGEEGQVVCRAEDRKAVAAMIEELNGERNEHVPPVAEAPVDILGGFVFRTDKFDVDYSLESQLGLFREKVLPELIEKAFPET